MPIGYNELGINDDRQVIYRNFHEVTNKIYAVEFSKLKRYVFIVLFED